MTPGQILADNRLIVIGAGGHARVLIDVARAAGFAPVAALDPIGEGTCNGVEVLGGDDTAHRLFADGHRQGVIAIGDNRLRAKLGKWLEGIGFKLPSIVHPSAIVSASAEIGDGTVVMPLGVINASATVGRLAIVNTAAVIEHDCRIGDGVHVAPGCRLGGTVWVGEGALIGIGSVIRPEARVGAFAIIGAGSIVIEDIEAAQVAIGSPARAMRRT